METIKQRFNRTFLKPQGKFSRHLSTVFLFLVGAGSIYLYFAIDYFLCSGNRCDELVITKPWVNISAFFVVYGICCFVVGVFVFRFKQIQVIYAWALDLMAGSGFLLFGKSFSAIAIEIGKNT